MLVPLRSCSGGDDQSAADGEGDDELVIVVEISDGETGCEIG